MNGHEKYLQKAIGFFNLIGFDFMYWSQTLQRGAVPQFQCLYWPLQVLWVLWPGRKLLKEFSHLLFKSGWNSTWLAWSTGARVPIVPIVGNINTFGSGLLFLVLVHLYSLKPWKKARNQIPVHNLRTTLMFDGTGFLRSLHFVSEG